MSREIKFRAWDKKQKKMFYGVSIGTIKVWDEDAPIISHEFAYSEDCEFEQYTGLKDKNGKEIYEGDIVKCHLSPISSVIFTGTVEFKPGCIMFKNFADNGSYAFNFLGAVEEVIGNIHENPDLL